MKLDKIMEKMNSLTFDLKTVTKLKESLTDDVYKKASMVSLLNMCINAKDLMGQLGSVESSIKIRRDELKCIDDECLNASTNTKNEMKFQQSQLKEARAAMNEKIKGWEDNASKRRAEIDKDLMQYETDASKKKKELGKEIKSREIKLQDTNTKIDEAENRKKELQESLK